MATLQNTQAQTFNYQLTFGDIPFVSDRATVIRMPDKSSNPFVPKTERAPALYEPMPDLIDELNRLIPNMYLEDWALPTDLQGYTLSAVSRLRRIGPQPDCHIRIGDYYYPTGASRFSVFRGLATSSMVQAMVAKCGASTISTLQTSGATSQPLVPSQWTPQEFVMQCPQIGPNNTDGTSPNYTIKTNLYFLSARPMGELALNLSGLDGLYLVTLVDERYWWFRNPISFQVNQFTTWDSMIEQCATNLGVEINFVKTNKVYGQPEPDSQLWTNTEPTGYMLDAIAMSTGRTVVRNFDGSYTLQGSELASRIALSNRVGLIPTNLDAGPAVNSGTELYSGILFDGPTAFSGTSLSGSDVITGPVNPVIRVAGGEIYPSGGSLPVGDLRTARNAVLPASYTVSFPQYVMGDDPVPHYVNPRYVPQRPGAWFEESYGQVWTVNIPLSSGIALSGVAYISGFLDPSSSGYQSGTALYTSGLVGTSGFTQILHSTAKALYSGELQAASGGIPINASALTALAINIANSATNKIINIVLDEVYPGTYAWQPEGLHDVIWTYSERVRLAATRVMKTQWNNEHREASHSFGYSGGSLLYTDLNPGVTLTSGSLSGYQNSFTYTLPSGSIISGLPFTNVPRGVGGRSVAQAWRDSIFNLTVFYPLSGSPLSGGILSGTALSGGGFTSGVGTLSGNLTSGGIWVPLAADLKSGDLFAKFTWIDFLPTQNRWRGRIDTETILFEGTSGGNVPVGAALFGSGGAVLIHSGDTIPSTGFFLEATSPTSLTASGSVVVPNSIQATDPSTGNSGLDIFGAGGGATLVNSQSVGQQTDQTGYLITDPSAELNPDGSVFVPSAGGPTFVSGVKNTVAIVYRAIDGTVQDNHFASGSLDASGNLVPAPTWAQQLVPDTNYGTNLITFEKGQFTYPGLWTSAGIQEQKIIPQVQSIQVLCLSGVKIGPAYHYSGQVNVWDPALDVSGNWRPLEYCWAVERNSGAPTSGSYYEGTFVGWSASASGLSGIATAAPIYLFNVGGGGTVTGVVSGLKVRGYQTTGSGTSSSGFFTYPSVLQLTFGDDTISTTGFEPGFFITPNFVAGANTIRVRMFDATVSGPGKVNAQAVQTFGGTKAIWAANSNPGLLLSGAVLNQLVLDPSQPTPSGGYSYYGGGNPGLPPPPLTLGPTVYAFGSQPGFLAQVEAPFGAATNNNILMVAANSGSTIPTQLTLAKNVGFGFSLQFDTDTEQAVNLHATDLLGNTADAYIVSVSGVGYNFELRNPIGVWAYAIEGARGLTQNFTYGSSGILRFKGGILVSGL